MLSSLSREVHVEADKGKIVVATLFSLYMYLRLDLLCTVLWS